MNLNATQIQLFGLAMIFYVIGTLGFSSFFNLVVSEAEKKGLSGTSISSNFTLEDIIQALNNANNYY